MRSQFCSLHTRELAIRCLFAGIEKKGLGRKNSLVHMCTKFSSTYHWLELND